MKPKILLLLSLLLLNSGCIAVLNQAQMRKKFPAINATNGHMEFSTIYGVAGQMTAGAVSTTTGKNGDKIQTFKGYSESMTSPLGSTKASFDRISFRNGVPVADEEAK